MNRVLLIGIAIFLAVVGIALMGGENKVLAGHGCHGCDGCAGACDGGGCAGACHGCHGRRHCGGLFHRHRCCGNPCCGAAPACCGCDGGAAHEAAPATPPASEAPAPSASLKRPFRVVHFRS